MWPQFEPLVERLVTNPYDADALARAHEAAAMDPESYALLLERVGAGSSDVSHASHWFVEAANIWSTTLGDAHRAARVLMVAIDRDPTQRLAAQRLAQLYRDKGEVTSLVALFERRAKALAPLAHGGAEVLSELAATYEELGHLWSESFKKPKRALESFRLAAASYEGVGDLTGARRALAYAREVDPTEADLQLVTLGVLADARVLAGEGRDADAYPKYREVLASVPAHPEALLWVEDYLRSQRDYLALRDVLVAAAREPGESVEARTERLRKLAELSERTLRDAEGAIHAYEQLLAIDRGDDVSRRSLIGLLEHSGRWDGLASLLQEEAKAQSDLEDKIALEKQLAQLQQTKRHDLVAAAQAWGRIARLTPEDDLAIGRAYAMFTRAGALDDAARVIADNASQVTDTRARSALLERLGEVRERLEDAAGAGDAYVEAAEVRDHVELWAAAERCFVYAGCWDRAAHAADQRAHIASDSKQRAAHLARAAEHLGRAGKDDGVIARLEQAIDLDPTNDPCAERLNERYTSASRWSELVELLTKRGDRLRDAAQRIAVRRRAANLCAQQLSDKEAACKMWGKVLEDGDDREALENLVEDAIERGEFTEATTLLRRLSNTAVDADERTLIALREAELLAERLGNVDAAVARYEEILADLSDPAERAEIGRRLARLCEQLDDSKSAIRALEVVHEADSGDLDVLDRLCNLCEKTTQWERVAELLVERIELEVYGSEASTLTYKLANILATKLDRGFEALAALTELADQGDAAIRAAYIELGDRLGWKWDVATKLVDWWLDANPSAQRTAHLRGAFDRFIEVGRDQDALRLGVELARAEGADRRLAEQLEQLAVKMNELEALSTAHDLLALDMRGPQRAAEMLRQAEVRLKAGAPRREALEHGESALTSISPEAVEPMLQRLATIAGSGNDIVDLYERQVSRTKAPSDRVAALARAAQVAATHGELDRARGFFELALSGSPNDETLSMLERTARETDERAGSRELRRALCQAFASRHHGSGDGGRTGGALLRRAAAIAQRDLNDVEQAFAWLVDALVGHVEEPTLDMLERLALDMGEPRRADAALSRALSEVLDVAFVRRLLSRRAKIRREYLGDKAGAAADLKELHDLSPTDRAVTDKLLALLTSLDDHRGMVQLCEGAMLRAKDMKERAELARKVARMWEEQLQDPREAADAWRRVLRMNHGDAEATAGLQRAKANMLKGNSDEAPPSTS
jgi:hypothetical protein